MKKNFRISLTFFTVIFCILQFAISTLYAKDKLDIEANFSLATGDEIWHREYYSIASDLMFKFEVEDRFDSTLELDADRFEVEVDEIYFTWKASSYLYIRLGKFENALTLDEYIPKNKRKFAVKSLISSSIDSQGYIGNSMGIKLYKKHKKDTVPISYLFHLAAIPGHLEVQFDFGFFYHFDGKDSYLGLLCCYFPFIAHEIWPNYGPPRFEVIQLHNYLFDLIFANYENNLIYGIELTYGSNLVSPIGLINYPVKTDRPSFLGADFHIGYFLSLNKIRWLPSLRYSILFPELTVSECHQMEIRLGNMLQFSKRIKLHIDGGIGVTTRYSMGTLYTNLKPLWALYFIVSI